MRNLLFGVLLAAGLSGCVTSGYYAPGYGYDYYPGYYGYYGYDYGPYDYYGGPILDFDYGFRRGFHGHGGRGRGGGGHGGRGGWGGRGGGGGRSFVR